MTHQSHDLFHESSNPFPLSRPSHMTSPGYPPWVYKLPQDSVECAVPWRIYYWPLLLLQLQQLASAEVSLQPDSPAHRFSLPRLLPESIANLDSCLSPQSVCSPSWLQAISPVPSRTFQNWNWARASWDLCSTDLGSPMDPGLSFQQVKGNLSITTVEVAWLLRQI